MIPAELQLPLFTVLLIVVWYLLRQKDERQGKEMLEIKSKHTAGMKEMQDKHTLDMNELYKLHNEDVAKLAAFETEIAKTHYPKDDLDKRFEQLDSTIKDGFSNLGGNFKEMTKAFQDHLNAHSGAHT